MDELESHPVPDTVDREGWKLHVTGAVAQSVQFTQEELMALPAGAFTDDFTCVEGWRAQDLTWRGVRLGAVLSEASPMTDASYLLVHAMDGEYASSFPLGRARDALLAFELEGERLSVDHGGPVRLIPTDDDTDCWESIKWVSEIEVTVDDQTDRDTAKRIALNRVAETPDRRS